MNKYIIIIALGALVLVFGGAYWYQSYKPEVAVEIPAEKRNATIVVLTDDQGVNEGLELSAIGINGTNNFSVSIALAHTKTESAVATIDYKDNQLILFLGNHTITIDGNGTPSALFTEKTKIAYNHDPLPSSVAAFDALRLLAIGLAQIPNEQPLTADAAYQGISNIKKYGGEDGAIERDGDHFRRLP